MNIVIDLRPKPPRLERLNLCVVCFDYRFDTAHPKWWSKFAFSCYLHIFVDFDAEMMKYEAKKNLLKFSPGVDQCFVSTSFRK